ncbi:hypothetical protein V8E52_008673 [Russula decolorans]
MCDYKIDLDLTWEAAYHAWLIPSAVALRACVFLSVRTYLDPLSRVPSSPMESRTNYQLDLTQGAFNVGMMTHWLDFESRFLAAESHLIRFDFNGPNSNSGTSTPRRSPTSPRPPLIEDDFPNDLLKASALVIQVALKKYSIEEVTALLREVDRRWLMEVTTANASIALCLSFLLLKATFANHVVFSDASKAANYKEMSSKLKVDRLELKKGRLEVKLHKLFKPPDIIQYY